MSRRPPLSVFYELALEAFITGVFMTLGEEIVSQTRKSLKKRLKKLRKDAGADDSADRK